MQIGLSLPMPRAVAHPRVSFEPTEDGVRLRLVNIGTREAGAVEVDSLSIDGVDRLSDITAASTDIVTGTTFPKSVANGGVLAQVTADDLVPGEWYLLQYSITAQAAAGYPFFASGSPFPSNTYELPRGLGNRSLLVQVEEGYSGTGAVELIRANGAMTVSNVSLYKAQWEIDLSAAREWATDTDPGTLTGASAANVMALEAGGTITQGDSFTLSYEVIEAVGATQFFVPNTGSPFPFADLPRTVGVHHVSLTADADTAERTVLMRLTGTIKFGFVSLRKAGDGRDIEATVSIGSQSYSGSTVAPLPNVWHVAGAGNDFSGTGAPEAPFRTPARAMEFAAATDTLYLRAGRYAGVDVTVSGSSTSARFRITTLDGEERLPVVVGLSTDEAVATGNYAAIRVREVDNVEVSKLTISDTKKEGVLAQGQEPEDDDGTPPTYGGHLIEGNKILRTGSSGIMACGFYPGKRIGTGNAATEEFRLSGIIIRGNDVSETNVANDYNAEFTNADGDPGGNNEAITISSSVSDYLVEGNHVHDTLQYGIDTKSGTSGGVIRFNWIWNCANHGLYIDASRRFVDDLDVHGNVIWGCRNGLVLAREADFDYDDPPGSLDDFAMRLHNIRVWNNLIFNIDRNGAQFYAHPGDYPSGEISDVVFKFNTIVNCGQEEAFRDEIRMVDWADADWLSAAVVSGFESIGNLAWRSDGETDVVDEFSGNTGFTVSDNFDGGSDPLFEDTSFEVVIGEGDFLPTITLPDFRLKAGSPALALVTGESAAPYDEDASGLSRPDPAAAGAYGQVA